MSIRYKEMSMPKELGFITPAFMTVFGPFLSDPMQEYHEGYTGNLSGGLSCVSEEEAS
jgi:hypothetical protein